MIDDILTWVTNALDEFTHKNEFVAVYRAVERHDAYEWLYYRSGDPLEEDRLVVSLGAWTSGPEDDPQSWQFQSAAGLSTNEGYTRRTFPPIPAELAGLMDNEWHFAQIMLEPAFLAIHRMRYEEHWESETGATFVVPRPFPPDRATGHADGSQQ